MKFKTLTLAALLSIGVLAVDAFPANAQADGILLKVQLRGTNYCHLRFPAIQEGTLASNRPVLKNPSSGDIVDFYGPCDYDPTGAAAVRAQRHAAKIRFSRDYLD